MENDEKAFDLISSQIQSANTSIVNFENEFKQFLQKNKNNNNNNGNNNNMNYDIIKKQIKNNLVRIEKNMYNIVQHNRFTLCAYDVANNSSTMNEMTDSINNQLKKCLKLLKKQSGHAQNK